MKINRARTLRNGSTINSGGSSGIVLVNASGKIGEFTTSVDLRSP